LLELQRQKENATTDTCIDVLRRSRRGRADAKHKIVRGRTSGGRSTAVDRRAERRVSDRNSRQRRHSLCAGDSIISSFLGLIFLSDANQPDTTHFIMHILWTIVIGFVVGAIAKLLMPGKDPGGFIVTILLGIAGAFVGTWIGRLFAGETYTAGWIMSVLGAVILLLLYRLFFKRST
jgi:uncharacterized membrane protein YeaQ/YmgE (transglycosylase-associated protein family)